VPRALADVGTLLMVSAAESATRLDEHHPQGLRDLLRAS
jgi:hypothetical protein